MKKWIFMIAGGVLLLIGSVVPGGVFLMATGTVMLICASPWFRKCLQFLREKSTLFNRLMAWMESKVPQKIADVLKLTQPGYVPQPGDHGA